MKFRNMVGPIVVFAAVLMLLVAARFYDRLPVQAPDCQFKLRTGIPCLACRGTRCFHAISKGQIIEAIKLNPAAILGVLIAAWWLISYLVRRGNPPSKTMAPAKVAWIVGLLLVGNWVFLIVTRHWYP